MRRLLLISACLSALLAAAASAGQVDWSSSAFSIHQRSDGTALDDSFVFELGAFADGFLPTAANTADWAAHWRVAQRSPYNPITQIVSGSYVIETNDAPFTSSSQGYLWGLSPAHPGEWVLLTNVGWKWPGVGGATPPVSWTVRNASNVILGSVNDSGAPFFLRTASVPASTPVPWVSGSDWQARHFTATQITNGTADWLADPDGDGKTNLDEMAYDTNPLAADGTTRVTGTVSIANRLEMTVTKAPKHVLEYRVEVSSDLRAWSHAPEDIQIIRESATTLVVRDRTPVTNTARRFIRLTVELD